jgi:hypothetical protein
LRFDPIFLDNSGFRDAPDHFGAELIVETDDERGNKASLFLFMQIGAEVFQGSEDSGISFGFQVLAKKAGLKLRWANLFG